MQFGQLKRREFVTLPCGAAAWPLAARAQQLSMPVVGFLNAQSPNTFAHLLAAFRVGLDQAGYVEGRNVAIEYRWAEGRIDSLPALATELVRRSVDVIVATGGAQLVAKSATSTIPIVFTSGDDPIKEGLVASFNKPGGNATGATVFSATIESKRVALLHELLPKAIILVTLIDPSFSGADFQLAQLQAAARALGKQVHVLNANTDNEIDTAFSSIMSEIEPIIAEQARDQSGGLILMPDTFLLVNRAEITSLADRYALPALYPYSNYTKVGGLVSYGYDLLDNYRRAAIYADRILRGTKPSELPVQLPVKVQLTVNLRTAKALGLKVPSSILLRADEVIE
jgi:putative ABC transport system substrate-binding protein